MLLLLLLLLLRHDVTESGSAVDSETSRARIQDQGPECENTLNVDLRPPQTVLEKNILITEINV